MKLTTILDQIGNTPHLHLQRIFPLPAKVWMKLERQNPGGSIKDRIALAMVEDAEARGELRPGATIVEPTSGNTGVGLALVGAVKGYPVILVMPDSMSVERRRLMTAYGARVELTPREEGMDGSISRAQELAGQIPGAWMPMQFENPANPAIHGATTAREILEDFPEGFDTLVTGVGTGGHITGMARVLKGQWPHLQVVAVEPRESAVLSGGPPGMHHIQGIGAGFVPPVLDRALVDEVVTISRHEAFHWTQRAAREEGVLVGISSGASLAAVSHILQNSLAGGARILTVCYDTGERYLSTAGLFG